MASHQVTIIPCREYDRMPEAFDELRASTLLADFGRGVNGKTVLVKPNILGLFEPEQAVTTHPALVATVVTWLRSAGARVIVGDNCGVGGYGLNQQAAQHSGILHAAGRAYENIARDVLNIAVDSRFFRELVVSRAVLEADFVISLPKLKTHTLTLLTGGIKNMFGMLAGTSKSMIHRCAPQPDAFGEALVDIYQVRPPDLTIIDGIYGMDGNGPSHGRIRNFGYLIAGDNAVACDLAVAHLASVSPQRIDHLRHAAERNLGPGRIRDLDLNGCWDRIPGFRLPNSLVSSRLFGRAINRHLYQPIIRSRLVLDRDKCNGCRLCMRACPILGITWSQDHPALDSQTCIRCLCCFEVCPQGAWKIQGMLARLIGRQI